MGITVPDTFDSGEFEWTQLSCSPELNCSPVKQQVFGYGIRFIPVFAGVPDIFFLVGF